MWARSSELLVEGDLAFHADLVRGDRPLEEVGVLCDVLERHEVKWILRSEALREAKSHQSLIGDVLEVLANMGEREARDSLSQHVGGESHLDLDSIFDHVRHAFGESRIEELRLLGADDVD